MYWLKFAFVVLLLSLPACRNDNNKSFTKYDCFLLEESIHMAAIDLTEPNTRRVNILNFDGQSQDIFYHVSSDKISWIKGASKWKDTTFYLDDIKDNKVSGQKERLLTVATSNEEFTFGRVSQPCLRKIADKYDNRISFIER